MVYGIHVCIDPLRKPFFLRRAAPDALHEIQGALTPLHGGLAPPGLLPGPRAAGTGGHGGRRRGGRAEGGAARLRGGVQR